MEYLPELTDVATYCSHAVRACSELASSPGPSFQILRKDARLAPNPRCSSPEKAGGPSSPGCIPPSAESAAAIEVASRSPVAVSSAAISAVTVEANIADPSAVLVVLLPQWCSQQASSLLPSLRANKKRPEELADLADAAPAPCPDPLTQPQYPSAFLLEVLDMEEAEVVPLELIPVEIEGPRRIDLTGLAPR